MQISLWEFLMAPRKETKAQGKKRKRPQPDVLPRRASKGKSKGKNRGAPRKKPPLNKKKSANPRSIPASKTNLTAPVPSSTETNITVPVPSDLETNGTVPVPSSPETNVTVSPSSPQEPNAKAPAPADHRGKYLTFSLGHEEFGIGIQKVKEIIGRLPVTKIPGTPSFISGVINLRGRVIPVADLRVRFGMEEAAGIERRCIIVVEIGTDTGPIPMGMVVDSVSEVVNIRGEDLVAAPDFGVKMNLDYILALAKTNGNVKILLDIDKLLTA